MFTIFHIVTRQTFYKKINTMIHHSSQTQTFFSLVTRHVSDGFRDSSKNWTLNFLKTSLTSRFTAITNVVLCILSCPQKTTATNNWAAMRTNRNTSSPGRLRGPELQQIHAQEIGNAMQRLQARVWLHEMHQMILALIRNTSVVRMKSILQYVEYYFQDRVWAQLHQTNSN